MKRASRYILSSTQRLRYSSDSGIFAEEEPFPAGDNFGQYSVILPEEPWVFGVHHIKPRNVPNHIPRPNYALPVSHNLNQQDPGDKDGRFPLGGIAERKLREAASLARDVREYSKTLVKVCFGLLLPLQLLLNM